MSEHGDTTLASYEAAAAVYREHSLPAEAMTAFLDRIVGILGVGKRVLELGSGHGLDAAYLETRGLLVTRTDGALAFVEMMRADGYIAHVLDVRRDAFGGPYDAVLADAVFLHLSRAEFADAIARAHDAVVAGGVLALTLKVGDGEAWSTAKLGLPRFFTYWREPAVRVLLEAAGWIVDSIDHVDGHTEPWIYVLAHSEGVPVTGRTSTADRR